MPPLGGVGAFDRIDIDVPNILFYLATPTKKLKAIYFTRKSDKFLTHYACLLREIGAAATKAVQSKMIYNGVLSTGRVLLVLFCLLDQGLLKYQSRNYNHA